MTIEVQSTVEQGFNSRYNCWNLVYAVHCSLYTGCVYIGLTPLFCLNQVVNSNQSVATGYEPGIARAERSPLPVVTLTASLIALAGESSYVVRGATATHGRRWSLRKPMLITIDSTSGRNTGS